MKLGLSRSAQFALTFRLVNVLLLAVAILLYEMQIVDGNADLGYRHVGGDPQHLLLLIVSVLVVGALRPVETRRTCDLSSRVPGIRPDGPGTAAAAGISRQGG